MISVQIPKRGQQNCFSEFSVLCFELYYKILHQILFFFNFALSAPVSEILKRSSQYTSEFNLVNFNWKIQKKFTIPWDCSIFHPELKVYEYQRLE